MPEVKIGDFVQILRPGSTEVAFKARVVGFDQAAVLVVPDSDDLPDDPCVVAAERVLPLSR
jgi:hypothetical protein